MLPAKPGHMSSIGTCSVHPALTCLPQLGVSIRASTHHVYLQRTRDMNRFPWTLAEVQNVSSSPQPVLFIKCPLCVRHLKLSWILAKNPMRKRGEKTELGGVQIHSQHPGAQSCPGKYPGSLHGACCLYSLKFLARDSDMCGTHANSCLEEVY